MPKVHEDVVVEGAEGPEPTTIREELNIPITPAERRRYFQDETNRKKFDFEPDRMYLADFGNPYLVFNGELQRTVRWLVSFIVEVERDRLIIMAVLDFSLRLPGFTVHVMRYVDEKNHDLRYVLKDGATGRVYLVVLFTLVLGRTDEETEHKEQIGKGFD